MAHRRGDNIPPVSAYAHWNEDAERVWYEENRYDMEHADEIIEDGDDRNYIDDEYEDYETFKTREEADAFFKTKEFASDPRQFPLGEWYVEFATDAQIARWSKRRRH